MPTKNRSKSKISLKIDRFFKDSRDFEVNSFQNVHESLLEVYKKYDVPYVLTTKPKRSFITNGNLGEKGMRIYYQMDSKSRYEEFIKILYDEFKENFYLKQKSYKLIDNEVDGSSEERRMYSGYFQITNKKEEKK